MYIAAIIVRVLMLEQSGVISHSIWSSEDDDKYPSKEDDSPNTDEKFFHFDIYDQEKNGPEDSSTSKQYTDTTSDDIFDTPAKTTTLSFLDEIFGKPLRKSTEADSLLVIPLRKYTRHDNTYKTEPPETNFKDVSLSSEFDLPEKRKREKEMQFSKDENFMLQEDEEETLSAKTFRKSHTPDELLVIPYVQSREKNTDDDLVLTDTPETSETADLYKTIKEKEANKQKWLATNENDVLRTNNNTFRIQDTSGQKDEINFLDFLSKIDHEEETNKRKWLASNENDILRTNYGTLRIDDTSGSEDSSASKEYTDTPSDNIFDRPAKTTTLSFLDEIFGKPLRKSTKTDSLLVIPLRKYTRHDNTYKTKPTETNFKDVLLSAELDLPEKKGSQKETQFPRDKNFMLREDEEEPLSAKSSQTSHMTDELSVIPYFKSREEKTDDDLVLTDTPETSETADLSKIEKEEETNKRKWLASNENDVLRTDNGPLRIQDTSGLTMKNIPTAVDARFTEQQVVTAVIFTLMNLALPTLLPYLTPIMSAVKTYYLITTGKPGPSLNELQVMLLKYILKVEYIQNLKLLLIIMEYVQNQIISLDEIIPDYIIYATPHQLKQILSYPMNKITQILTFILKVLLDFSASVEYLIQTIDNIFTFIRTEFYTLHYNIYKKMLLKYRCHFKQFTILAYTFWQILVIQSKNLDKSLEPTGKMLKLAFHRAENITIASASDIENATLVFLDTFNKNLAGRIENIGRILDDFADRQLSNLEYFLVKFKNVRRTGLDKFRYILLGDGGPGGWILSSMKFISQRLSKKCDLTDV